MQRESVSSYAIIQSQRESVSSYAIIQSVLYKDVAVDCFIVILQPIHSYDRDAVSYIYDCTGFVREPW